MRTCDPKRGLQILDAAAQLFAKRRYHEVRMDDIAESAGVAKGTLYKYYHDKEDLYVALTVHGAQQLYEESQRMIAGPGDADQKLRDFITGCVRFYERYPYFLELIQRIETSNTTASVAALSGIRTQFYHLTANLLSQIQEAGQPVTVRPEWATLALLGMIRGILRFTAQPWPEHLPDWIYHQFMNGLTAPTLDHELDDRIPKIRFLPTTEPSDHAGLK